MPDVGDADSSSVFQDHGATRSTSIGKERITSNYVTKFCHARNVVLRFVRDRLSSVESMCYVLDVIDNALAEDVIDRASTNDPQFCQSFF